MSTQFERCRKSLATVWFTGAALTFTLIFLQTLFGKFDGAEKRAWSWYLPTVMPTLSLIIGALVTDRRSEPSADARCVDPFLYRLAMSLSAAYFLVMLGPVMAQPFTDMTILEVLDLSSLWLGPLQGLVAASLGAFFIRSEARLGAHHGGVTDDNFGGDGGSPRGAPRARVRTTTRPLVSKP
jgi:hypothetical protein